MRFCVQENPQKPEPQKEECRSKLISFHDILILKGGWKMSFAQILINFFLVKV